MMTTVVLGYEDARRALETVSRELKRRALGAVITVADDHGELIALMRMDGAPLSSTDGAVVGAVAVSGAPEAVDIELAALGAATIVEGRGTSSN